MIMCNKRRFAINYLSIFLFSALLIPMAVSAAEQPSVNDVSYSERWTLSADVIALSRFGGTSQALVSRVSGNVIFGLTAVAPSTEAFNSNQFQQGISIGPKISLSYNFDSRYGIEGSYFNIANQSASVTVGPDNPADWLVMKSPGGFWQTQDFPYQGMTWAEATNLYNAEINGRLAVSDWLTLLTGFRWLQLNDSLQGTLTPTDRTAPDWKTTAAGLLYKINEIPEGANPPGDYPPFWTANTENNLFGLQIGAEGKILKVGRFSLAGHLKTGIYDNYATQSAAVSIAKAVTTGQATTNQVAFASEAGLTIKYQLIHGLELQAGYEVILLDGIALAPQQIQQTYAAPHDVHALGIDSGANVLFQGAICGVCYSF